MTNFFDNDDFEVIPDSEVESIRRGRKPNEQAVELSAHLANFPVGQTIRVTKLQANSDKEKQANGTLIRNAAKLAGVKVSIRWTANRVPQITVKP